MEFAHYDKSQEEKRIEELQSLQIMDTAKELSFDQFTYLASSICETPIALLSFINSERQWFKSTVGLDIQEVPKHLSPCLRTIQQNEILEVPNMLEDPFFVSNHFTIHSHFRFYAGVPLVSSHHYNIGTLCVIDYVPRKLSELQLKTLKIIAEQIMVQVDLRCSYRKTLKELRDMGKSKYLLEQRYKEIIHKSRMKALAELAAGLNFQLTDPLNLFRVSTHHLRALYSGDIDELKIIDRSIGRIQKVIDSLESIINIEKNKAMGPLDLSSIVNETLISVEGMIKEKKIKLRKSIGHPVMAVGNSGQISLALSGVLMNAIQAIEFLNERSIEVELKTENGLSVIRIKDSGLGVDSQIQDFIFEPFYSTKGNDHLGMGLSLSRDIIQTHGGDLVLEKSERPTVFKLTLPQF